MNAAREVPRQPAVGDGPALPDNGDMVRRIGGMPRDGLPYRGKRLRVHLFPRLYTRPCFSHRPPGLTTTLSERHAAAQVNTALTLIVGEAVAELRLDRVPHDLAGPGARQRP